MSGWLGGGIASRMLVGQLIDLPFLPAPIPRGLALWDGDVHAIAAYPRLFAKIGQAFKLPGDVYNEATHFRFGGGAVFRKGAPYVVPSSSVYPLADDGTVATALGRAHLPMTAPGYQSYTFQQTAGAATVRLGLPANLAAASLAVPAAGAIAAQHKITFFDVPAAGEYHDAGGLLLVVLDGVGAVAGFAALSIYQRQDGGTFANLSVNAAPAGEVIVAAPVLGKSVGLYVNADGTIGWTAAGADRGAVPGLVVAPGNSVVFGTVVNDGAVYTAGLVASADFLAATADLTEPFPVGTMGAGNALGGGIVGGYVFGRGGSNTTDGHALTAAEGPTHDHFTVHAAAANGALDATNSINVASAGGLGNVDYGLQGTAGAATIGLTSSSGAAAPHAHTFDPTHDTHITLVRV